MCIFATVFLNLIDSLNRNCYKFQFALNDDKVISEIDYGNYYITEKDIGKKRADVIGKRLAELNTNCIVNKYSGVINNDVVSKYHMVVFTNFKFNEFYFQLNEYCRSKNIKTIFAQSKGFFGFVFCDAVLF